MRDDGLIQQIQSDVDANDKKIELDDKIDKAVDAYEKDIPYRTKFWSPIRKLVTFVRPKILSDQILSKNLFNVKFAFLWYF